MTKPRLIMAVAATVLLGGCGGTTVYVLTRSTPSPNLSAATLVAACFKSARVFVRGPQPAGRGTAVYVITPDHAAMGFVKARNATIAGRLWRTFAQGDHIKPLKNDPTAFTFYKGRLTRGDSILLSKCAR